MSKIRNFWVGLPAACGVPEGLAKSFGNLNGEMFDWERGNHGGVLRRVHGQTARQRLARAFVGWRDLAEDQAAVEYAEALGEFLDASIQYNEHGIGNKIELEATAATLKVYEPKYPKVAELLTVDTASVQGQWA
jgi:hypothetical protein